MRMFILLVVFVFFLITTVFDSVRSHGASDHPAYRSKSATTKLVTKEPALMKTIS